MGTAVEAIRRGAIDYLCKPGQAERILKAFFARCLGIHRRTLQRKLSRHPVRHRRIRAGWNAWSG